MITIGGTEIKIPTYLVKDFSLTTSVFTLVPQNKIKDVVLAKNVMASYAPKVKDKGTVLERWEAEARTHNIYKTSNTFLTHHILIIPKWRKHEIWLDK